MLAQRAAADTAADTPRLGCSGCRDAQPTFPFTMAFQPVVDVEQRRIVAYEALVRGVDGAGAGAILAQVTKDNRYAFDQACRVKAIEMATALGIGGTSSGSSDCQLNINFLPNAVYEPAACIRLTLEAARRTGFPLDRITFEIVEQEDLADSGHLQRIIAEYRRHGFRVALDDFATGFSGLSRLALLKPDIVKLDRVLIQDCDQDPVRLAIVRHMAALCRETGIKLVLEGVETAAEVAALRAAGGRFMQGFAFARPEFETIARDGDIPWDRLLRAA
jgi:EAL domain-containing protein (putative c-di-GMP-specific phosphodiesterase class I)